MRRPIPFLRLPSVPALVFFLSFLVSLVAADSGDIKPPPVLRVDDGRVEGAELAPGQKFPLATVDLSGDEKRQVVVAPGTEEIYNGQASTVLLPDGKTIYCVWTYGHGGSCGPMKRSLDGGLTWSPLIDLPESWTAVQNSPAMFRLTDPSGNARLWTFAGRGADGTMQQSHSDDDGQTWSPMTSNGLRAVVPFFTIIPVENGKRLLALTNMRRPGETKEKRSNVVAQSWSGDGGSTWTPMRIVADLPGLVPCEPAVIRSPDGKQLLCLMRENALRRSLYMTSDDEGQTWSEVKQAPIGLAGDRHVAKYSSDGRLVICFRDRAAQSGTVNHFVAWVGRYEDIVGGREGQYRIKLLHSNAGYDCGYSGLELLPDGTFVATTYIKYRPGPEKHSIISTRFKLEETDRMALQGGKT